MLLAPDAAVEQTVNNKHVRGDEAARPVLVAGGAGFLGSHLCERLLAQGRTVICLDNFCTGSPETVAGLATQPGFQLLRCDIAGAEGFNLSKIDAPASEIYNLACRASPPRYQAAPLETLLSNVVGTRNLLEIARRRSARFFQASTSEIYGHPTVHPQPEMYWGHVNPMGPRSCYDEGKRCAETLCYLYQHIHRVAVRVARIFNTYGPRMSLEDGRVIASFICQALRNQPLTVYGDGRQTRSFCYVDDLIDGIVLLMNPAHACHGPVNLGNPVEVRVIELAERIIALSGSRSRIVRRPLPQDDPPRRRPDIALARSSLGWKPRVDLDTGLMRTIADFDERLSHSDTPAAALATWRGAGAAAGAQLA